MVALGVSEVAGNDDCREICDLLLRSKAIGSVFFECFKDEILCRIDEEMRWPIT